MKQDNDLLQQAWVAMERLLRPASSSDQPPRELQLCRQTLAHESGAYIHSKTRRSIREVAQWMLIVSMCTLYFSSARATEVNFDRIVVDPAPGAGTLEKALADINGDGKLDIIIGYNGAGVYWYQFPASGNPHDTWIKHTIASSGDCYEHMQIFDVNGDGRPDIILSINNSVKWLQHPGGDGTGNWIWHDIADGIGHEVRLMDIDGDGKMDVVTSRTRNIDFQNSATSWTVVGWGGTAPGSAADGMALLDIHSGLGAINIVGATTSGIYWFENPREHGGNARTDPWIAHYIGANYGPDSGPSIATLDVNGDGRMDVITAPNEGTQGTVGLVWWEMPSDPRNGTWIQHTIDNTYQAVHWIEIADIDKDGHPDLIVTEEEQSHDVYGQWNYNNDRVAVFYGDGKGNFLQQVLETTGGQNQVAGDVDGDGDIDFISVNHGVYGAPNPVELFINLLINKGTGGGTGGSISGNVATAAASYDLTASGTADWAHWGGEGAYGNFDHKASGGSQISNVAQVGSGGNFGWWSDTSRTASWSDGTPTASSANNHGYIWSNGQLGTGFQFTVPADTTSRTLYVYCGASNASGTLTAHLSDGSAADFSQSYTGPGAFVYTITYKAGSANQNLQINLLKTGNNAGFTNGSADLKAAWLTVAAGGGTGFIGNGNGLSATYYDNIDFTGATVSRIDPTVNFDWGTGSPDPAIGPDTFSARWTGQIQAQFSETYTFFTESDDGIRLWVNGVEIINDWTDHAPTEDSATIALTAGQEYDIKLEYYENGGGAMAKLLWSSPSTSKQVVPQSQLYGTLSSGGTSASLNGTLAPAAGSYDLTALGTLDWAHWGGEGSYSNFDHKSSGGGAISNVTTTGSGGNYGWWSDTSRSASWSDGTPTVSNSNTHGYIWSNGALNTGFGFTVPADTTARTLYVYCGGSTASSTLSAHLSDGSAADFSQSYTGPGAFLYTINYQAASSGQSLKITLLKTGNNAGFTDGSADLKAAWLTLSPGAASTNPPPAIASAATATPNPVTPGTSVSFSVSASDSDGDALTYAWNFGDGTTGTGANTTHTYASVGNYAVVVIVSDGHGGTAASNVNVTVFNAINSGGAAVGTFAADQNFSGGNTYTTTTAINTSGVTNPAPQAVYQSERYGNFTYMVSNLVAGASYTVRLHFAEIWWNSAGQRIFNVSINGTQVLSNFDVYAAAGGNFIAIVEAFNATATNGQIVITYTTVKDNAKSSGIEIVSASAASSRSARVLTADAVINGDGAISSIDLGTVKAGKPFKVKLDAPESGTKAKLHWSVANTQKLAPGVSARSGVVGGRPRTPGMYTFDLQIKGATTSATNKYTLTVVP